MGQACEKWPHLSLPFFLWPLCNNSRALLLSSAHGTLQPTEAGRVAALLPSSNTQKSRNHQHKLNSQAALLILQQPHTTVFSCCLLS